MPYDERTLKELYEEAEDTPPYIQLDVNREIFSTIYNTLWSLRNIGYIIQYTGSPLLGALYRNKRK